MTITEEEVIFSRKSWESLKSNDYFREVLEVLEDIESLENSKANTEYFVDYDEYRKTRLAKVNV
jgi:hemerythrin superfamily protein